MGDSNLKTTVLALISIGIGLLALISESYRWIILGLFVLILIVTVVIEIFKRLESIEASDKIKKLEEKLKIHEQLIDIKASIKRLEERELK